MAHPSIVIFFPESQNLISQMEVNFRPRTRVWVSRSLIIWFSVSRHDALNYNKYTINRIYIYSCCVSIIGPRTFQFRINVNMGETRNEQKPNYPQTQKQNTITIIVYWSLLDFNENPPVVVGPPQNDTKPYAIYWK